MMKKIFTMAVAVLFAVAANAQVVIGLQGGYYQQSYNNPQLRTDVPFNGATVEQNIAKMTWLGGLQVGYQITPWLYFGVSGGVINSTDDNTISYDSIFINTYSHSAFMGMTLPVLDHQYIYSRMGWTVAPQLKVEFVRYGNMHFNILLQGSYTSMGYTNIVERYVKPFEKYEKEDFDVRNDGISEYTIDVSLRPTLVYDFSEHLSAELSLDFLSVGFIRHIKNIDDYTYVYGSGVASDGSAGEAYLFADPINDRPVTDLIPPHQITTETLYAGLNTLMQTLSWESPMLRLGFNWKF